jgi:hypothetical protein
LARSASRAPASAGIPQLELVALADQHHALVGLEHLGELGRHAMKRPSGSSGTVRALAER